MTLDPLPKVLEALAFAAFKHRHQKRKGVGATPYINHPIALARLLASEAGVTELDVICAALLHDTIEDTMTTKEELARAFGEPVAALVVEVTDNKMLGSRTRKRFQVEHAARISSRAKLVKLADKTCNLRDVVADPPDWTLERKREYFDWAGEVVDKMRGTHPRLENLFDQAFALRP
jgi:GTP diphosphokinase / guanosine-3',5'-bis(diphosphate) 3'-diphosphatase